MLVNSHISVLRSRMPGVASLLMCCLIVGCAEKKAEPEVVPVTGKVLLDGEPLEFGTVTFQPLRGQPAKGEIQPDGTFELSTFAPGDGAPVGKHQVRITCYESQRPGAEQNTNAETLGESLIPEKYLNFATSGIEVSVVSGGNKPFLFQLTREQHEASDEEDKAETSQSLENTTPTDKEESPDEQTEPVTDTETETSTPQQ